MKSRIRTCVTVFALLLATMQSARAELLVYYDFNDNANADLAKDKSGKGNDGELLGDVDVVPVYTADKGGHSGAAGDRAMDFGLYSTNGDVTDNNNVGSGAYLEITKAADGAFASITANDTFTVSVWVRGNDDQPAPQWTFSAWPPEEVNDRQIGAHTPWSNGNVYFDVTGCCGPNTRIDVAADPSMWDNSGWNHYAFVKDETYTAIYQNGEILVDSGDAEKDPMEDIGLFFVGAGPSFDRRSYSGLLDDFAVWDNALTGDQIMALANGAPVITPVGKAGDFNGDGVLDAADINALSAEVRAATNTKKFDVNNDNVVNDDDRQVWVNDLRKVYFGDANLDGEFDSNDFVDVFIAGQYEDTTPGNSGWATGDWDGDGDFMSADFVVAFVSGGYELGQHPAGIASVPEPSTLGLLATGLLLCWRRRK